MKAKGAWRLILGAALLLGSLGVGAWWQSAAGPETWDGLWLGLLAVVMFFAGSWLLFAPLKKP